MTLRRKQDPQLLLIVDTITTTFKGMCVSATSDGLSRAFCNVPQMDGVEWIPSLRCNSVCQSFFSIKTHGMHWLGHHCERIPQDRVRSIMKQSAYVTFPLTS
jgi:hypothetical protein